MIKVRILTGVAAAGAATIAIPSLAGCTADADDAIGTGAENNTESIAGSGAILLQGWTLGYKSTSGGDEFLRVGEKMKFSYDYNWIVTHFIAYDDATLAQALRADPSLVKSQIEVTYVRFDGSETKVLVPVTHQPGAQSTTTGNSDEFVIPKQVKRLKLDLLVQYTKNGTVQNKALLTHMAARREFAVFGGFLPNKLALFDTMGGDKRTRIVEGGSVVRGANLTLSVSDWRLDTLVDRSTLDLTYGETRSYNRFGPSIVPAVGKLEYEVDAVVSTDDGATWTGVRLDKIDGADVVSRPDAWRSAVHKELGIPANAASTLKVAFHVKAFLLVPYYSSQDTWNTRHPANSRVLLRDVWDNNGSQNYSLPIGAE